MRASRTWLILRRCSQPGQPGSAFDVANRVVQEAIERELELGRPAAIAEEAIVIEEEIVIDGEVATEEEITQG